ncbi:MAG: hypothetical protein MZW92_15770 [Comamonadaceae bacterium]|nr:hypothetical protein [Comamonadaceae bacterium]
MNGIHIFKAAAAVALFAFGASANAAACGKHPDQSGRHDQLDVTCGPGTLNDNIDTASDINTLVGGADATRQG